ncbi:MAG: HAD family hydrolase [Actinomycetales bacterium]
MGAAQECRGLVVDWGGVLTTSLPDVMSSWCASVGIDYSRWRALMARWLGPGAGEQALWNPIHALERGEIEVPDFERRLAAALTEDGAAAVPAEGLLDQMFRGFEQADDMVALVGRAKRAGLRTALLSNSWGNDYPREGWADLFDAVVISGEVGMRKPEERIYRHTLDLLELPAEEAVFVDDFPPNVQAAVAVGMVGVVHRSYEETADELEAIFSLPLRGRAA